MYVYAFILYWSEERVLFVSLVVFLRCYQYSFVSLNLRCLFAVVVDTERHWYEAQMAHLERFKVYIYMYICLTNIELRTFILVVRLL